MVRLYHKELHSTMVGVDFYSRGVLATVELLTLLSVQLYSCTPCPPARPTPLSLPGSCGVGPARWELRIHLYLDTVVGPLTHRKHPPLWPSRMNYLLSSTETGA